MDYRVKIRQPQTRMNDDELGQPIGRSGVDPQQQQPLDPIRTFETPLTYFPAEIVIGANFNGNVPLPRNCAQIAFISLVPGVAASINGGGGRTVKDGFVYNGLFTSLQVATDAAGSCIIQLASF